MRDDIAFPVTTGSAVALYGWTLQEVVLILWALYVLVLIVIKLPELTIAMVRIRGCVQRRWIELRGVFKRAK